MNIGIIGCGNISDTYLESQKIFKNLNIIACADIDKNISDKKANLYSIKSLEVEELLKSKEIDLILNLTIPSAHKDIIINSLLNGKHCFSEKPLATTFNEGLEIQSLAKNYNLSVGCAPDTFLGASGQKARKLIENDSIGKIVLGTFNIMSHGMEDWHPNPDFFFKPGAGPIFDLGVYYLTQLINLNGPIKSVVSSSATVKKERIILSKPRYGEKINVETPTTLIGTLHFYNDCKVNYFCSWDVWKHSHSHIELYGLDGSIILPDPNFFSGDILLANKNNNWRVINNDKMQLGVPNKVDQDGTKIANYRGIGLSEMIQSIKQNTDPRCSLELSLHVLEVMESIIKSSEIETKLNISTKPNKPDYLNEEEIKKLKKI